MKLAIISHTDHYINREGNIAGWGPTVREINHLTDFFDEIYHLAPFHNGKIAPESCLSYKSLKIHFVPLKPTGGKGIFPKFGILAFAPSNIRIINKILKSVDWFQLRLPTGLGVYLLPYFFFKRHPNMWVKYAGNWAEPNPPISYAFQRWWLKNNYQNCKVTINGTWPNQPSHLIRFENPCLTEDELRDAQPISSNKDFSRKLNLLFVGQLIDEKGVHIILNAIKALSDSSWINEVVFIGDGPKRAEYEKIAESCRAPVFFKGYLQREFIQSFYEKAHLLLLPSKSEGFPKVVAEAAAYGCIPIVTDVSSIGQYVENGVNGYLIKKNSAVELLNILMNCNENRFKLKEMSVKAQKLSEKFTFSYYNKRLISEVLTSV